MESIFHPSHIFEKRVFSKNIIYVFSLFCETYTFDALHVISTGMKVKNVNNPIISQLCSCLFNNMMSYGHGRPYKPTSLIFFKKNKNIYPDFLKKTRF